MRRFSCAVLLACLVVGLGANAETITIPVGQQAPENRDLPRPTRGMSDEAVVVQFGLPASKSEPVGEPPIMAWKYRHYTVYFESQTVIHSVLTHTPSGALDAGGE